MGVVRGETRNGWVWLEVKGVGVVRGETPPPQWVGVVRGQMGG